MKKKRYKIYHVSSIILRENGIKEPETFSFLIEWNSATIDYEHIKKQFDLQIQYYNEFCPDGYKIISYNISERTINGYGDNMLEIENVGELWL